MSRPGGTPISLGGSLATWSFSPHPSRRPHRTGRATGRSVVGSRRLGAAYASIETSSCPGQHQRSTVLDRPTTLPPPRTTPRSGSLFHPLPQLLLALPPPPRRCQLCLSRRSSSKWGPGATSPMGLQPSPPSVDRAIKALMIWPASPLKRQKSVPPVCSQFRYLIWHLSQLSWKKANPPLMKSGRHFTHRHRYRPPGPTHPPSAAHLPAPAQPVIAPGTDTWPARTHPALRQPTRGHAESRALVRPWRKPTSSRGKYTFREEETYSSDHLSLFRLHAGM